MSPAEPTLGPAKGLEKAVPRHRAALERCAATLGSLAPAVWTAPRGPGKWSPAQIGEHLILSYDILLTELSGGAGFRVRTGFWRRTFIRWRYLERILEAGRIPEGVPAPREIRPGETMRPQSDIVPELVGRGTRFERELSAALASRRVRLTHPYFGVITGVQALDYCSVHLEHHRRQLPGV